MAPQDWRKTDEVDARAVAAVALERDGLTRVGLEDHRSVLRMLADRRGDSPKNVVVPSIACMGTCVT